MPEPPRGSGRLPSARTVPGWSGTPGFAVAGMGQRLEVRSFYSQTKPPLNGFVKSRRFNHTFALLEIMSL